MEDQKTILTDLNVPTCALKSSSLKSLLSISHKLKQSGQGEQMLWNDITELLWIHLQTGLSKFDDQLLCATCFYNILRFNKNKDTFLEKVDIHIKRYYNQKATSNSVRDIKTDILLSLIYGLFQSPFLTDLEDDNIIITEIIILSLNVLIVMAYEYSNYTFTVFKIMSYLKKIENTIYSSKVFNEDRQRKLLALVIHSWESPLSGVRDLNKCIFGLLWNLFDLNIRNNTLLAINSFQWNKAKYLMISEIIRQRSDTALNICSENPHLVEGLIKSLYSTGLVSAGTDMYCAVLTKFNMEEEWCEILFQKVIDILMGKSRVAVGNFCNYWCLMTFKKFPSLFKLIFDKLQMVEHSDNTYSIMYVMKQANKLGILSKIFGNIFINYSIKNLICTALTDCDAHLRMLSFEIICTFTNTSMPSKEEFKHVYNFLEGNINSDTTVLRINMLSNLKSFLNKVHAAFINNIKNYNNIKIDSCLQIFCTNIQNLIIKCLDFKNANYQRRITCIKICDAIWTCFAEVKKKKYHSQQTVKKICLLQQLDEAGIWILNDDKFILELFKMLRDPADDIRECVVNLLLDRYHSISERPELFDKLIEDAFHCIKSKFFYEICCGHSIFKYIGNLLIKNDCKNLKYGKIEYLFANIYQELLGEYKSDQNIVHSIENGKQAHALINVLITIIQVCLKKSHSIENIINMSSLDQTLDILENISTPFAWDQEGTFSSDFSRMNLMVENVITRSGYNTYETDRTKISGMHQLVLNCMWLNVKASCDLNTALISCMTDNTQHEYCQRCLGIITKVLETSRHKGAIEAAGSALGEAVEHLTSLPNEITLSKLPYDLLKCELNEIMKDTNKMASITRRGAGLSIMIHRIVSNDKRKGKPLFHYFMGTLLAKCTTGNLLNNFENVSTTENDRDIPEAIYIHLMTRVVTDSSLQPDVMYYAANLGELAFLNLASKHWQIRNAALQLYGALVPKLLGQKKLCESNEDTVATVACDEFRTHSPKLWHYIIEQLELTNNDIEAHSNLVPILNLLAHMAKKYNFDNNSEVNLDFLKYLLRLLDSPIYTVRCLASKCIYLNFSLESVLQEINSENINISENLLHGYLLLTELYYNCIDNPVENNNIRLLEGYFCRIMNARTHSYLCRKLYDQMFLSVDILNKIEQILYVLKEFQSNRHAPGVSSWASVVLRKHIEKSSWHIMLHILKIILEKFEYEMYCEFLLQKIQFESNIPTEVSSEIVDLLMQFDMKFSSGLISEILYEISLVTNLSSCQHLNIVFVYLAENNYVVSHKTRYLIPFACNVLRYLNNYSYVLCLSRAIYLLSDPESIDVDIRCIAAQAINALSSSFSNFNDEIKINLLKAVIILLQDEEESVRNCTAMFVKTVLKIKSTLQPYVCLRKLMNYDCLMIIFGGSMESINELFRELSLILEKYKSKSNEKNNDCNPFLNDVKNIYFETDILRELMNCTRQ